MFFFLSRKFFPGGEEAKEEYYGTDPEDRERFHKWLARVNANDDNAAGKRKLKKIHSSCTTLRYYSLDVPRMRRFDFFVWTQIFFFFFWGGGGLMCELLLNY